jgi:hypothetical protein
MMTGDIRRLYPTFSHALLRIGVAETRRRWATDETLPSVAETLKVDVLEDVDWAVCDVDQDELERLILDRSLERDPRTTSFHRAAIVLWDLMDGSRPRTSNEEQAMRWLLIERCHAGCWDTPGIRELADDECERCLSPIDRPWAHDPGCSQCRRRFGIVWDELVGEPSEDEGASEAEEPLMKSA